MDYYEILGVSRNATADEIKVAFRNLRSRWHPDKDGGDDEKMQAINVAYDTLYDADLRAKYDRELNLGSAEDRRQACDQISAVFGLWIDNPHADLNDPVEFLHNSVHETLERIHKDIRKQRDRISRYNRLMTRVKYSGPEGDNIFQGTIGGALEDAQEALTALETQLRIVGIVKKLLTEYEHVPGARSAMPSVFSFGGGSAFHDNYRPDLWIDPSSLGRLK